MSTPRDDQGPNPFAPRPDDEESAGQRPQPPQHPAPPHMASPYGAPLITENAGTGNAQTRPVPRFPPAYDPERPRPSEASQGSASGSSGSSPSSSSSPFASSPPPWAAS